MKTKKPRTNPRKKILSDEVRYWHQTACAYADALQLLLSNKIPECYNEVDSKIIEDASKALARHRYIP